MPYKSNHNYRQIHRRTHFPLIPYCFFRMQLANIANWLISTAPLIHRAGNLHLRCMVTFSFRSVSLFKHQCSRCGTSFLTAIYPKWWKYSLGWQFWCHILFQVLLSKSVTENTIQYPLPPFSQMTVICWSWWIIGNGFPSHVMKSIIAFWLMMISWLVPRIDCWLHMMGAYFLVRIFV
jgi:hypothetical protein